MSRVSVLKRSISMAVAGLFLTGLLSPANATCRHDAVAVSPDLPISATADHASDSDHAPALACSGRPSATAPGRRSPTRDRLGMGVPAAAGRPRAGPQADHLPRGLTRYELIIPKRNNP